jgi:hypothetical protein
MVHTQRWWHDRVLATAVGVGFIIRLVPVLIWINSWGCLRDECTYLGLARKIVSGKGMVGSAGWLWAPGYPMIVAFHRWLTDFGTTTKVTQMVCAAVCTVLMYRLAMRVWADAGEDESRRAARAAAWLYALSPHMVFFAMSLWSEVIYGMILLFLLLTLDKARAAVAEGVPGWAKGAALVGVLAGICVLFRGVATYMVPIFGFALLWRQFKDVRAHQAVGIMVVSAVLTVAPYSIYISKKMDALVISDRTLGQMMWLGNNSFDPVTFDYGNGYLSKRAFDRHIKDGRDHCAGRKQTIKRDTCETQGGKDWILANPGAFVRRMPLRVAQMMNPHSLMTRHLRWGKWRGLPQWVDELLILAQALCSGFVLIGGSLALVARGRSGHGLVTGLILVYHCAAIAALAGLSRYRVPLEPLLMIYAAGLITRPRQVWAALLAERWRVFLAVLVMLWVIPLTLWFLPSGWTWWRSW